MSTTGSVHSSISRSPTFPSHLLSNVELREMLQHLRLFVCCCFHLVRKGVLLGCCVVVVVCVAFAYCECVACILFVVVFSAFVTARILGKFFVCFVGELYVNKHRFFYCADHKPPPPPPPLSACECVCKECLKILYPFENRVCGVFPAHISTSSNHWGV